MIKLENCITPSAKQWKSLILGARNPLNSWDLSDSVADYPDCNTCPYNDTDNCGKTDYFVLGEKDYDLMKRLCKAGTDHRKFMRMITVYVDITAPLYFFKEFDTYKVGTVANSCSTMHTIHKKEFTLDDFSHEHLRKNYIPVLEDAIDALNEARNIYLNGGMLDNFDGTSRMFEPKDKDVWWQMIQLLPSTYNQKRTIMMSYEVLANIYKSRKDHKLDEWHDFCDWIKTLPYSELITGEFDEQ